MCTVQVRKQSISDFSAAIMIPNEPIRHEEGNNTYSDFSTAIMVPNEPIRHEEGNNTPSDD